MACYSRFLKDSKPAHDDALGYLFPMHGKERVLGVLEVRMAPNELAAFAADPRILEWHNDVLETVAEILALCLVNVRLYEQLKRQTILDPLTGLYNRHHLLTQLEQEMRRTRRFHRELSVIFTDLDGFKEINDTYGHQRGDQILREIARLFQKNLRKSDFVCRYGGDEFVIVMPETSIRDAEAKAERLRVEVAAHEFRIVESGGQEKNFRLSISAGLACSHDGGSAEELLRIADVALYGAKREGRNRVFHLAASLEENPPQVTVNRPH